MCQVGSGLTLTVGRFGCSFETRPFRPRATVKERNGDQTSVSVVCAEDGGGLQQSSDGVSVWEVFV